MSKLTLIKKGDKLFAVDEHNQFQGRVTNTNTNEWLIDNPSVEESTDFNRIYGGHGLLLEIHENPPNPLYIKGWDEAFLNPDLLPVGTKAVFLDMNFNAKSDWDEIAR